MVKLMVITGVLKLPPIKASFLRGSNFKSAKSTTQWNKQKTKQEYICYFSFARKMWFHMSFKIHCIMYSFIQTSDVRSVKKVLIANVAKLPKLQDR